MKEVEEAQFGSYQAVTFKRSRLHLALPWGLVGLLMWTFLWAVTRGAAGVPDEELFTNFGWWTGLVALMPAGFWLALAPKLKIARWAVWEDSWKGRRRWTWDRVSNITLWRSAIGLPRITFDTPEGRAMLKGPWVGVEAITVMTALLHAKDAAMTDSLGSEGDLSDD